MRRTTNAANYRTRLRLETLESRNVLSVSAGFAATLAVPPPSLELETPEIFVVQMGPCGVDSTAGSSISLDGIKDAPDVILSDSPVVAGDVTTDVTLVADTATQPTQSDNSVVEPPTEVVSMPQSSIPDGVFERRVPPFPPLVLVADATLDRLPEAHPSVETPVTEYSCTIPFRLKRPPEQPVDQSATPATVSSTPLTNATSPDCGASAPLTVSDNPAPANTTPVSSEPVSTPPRGRASFRPITPTPPPAPPVENAAPVAVQVFQPVGFKPRRR